jgi:hypothetical protein
MRVGGWDSCRRYCDPNEPKLSFGDDKLKKRLNDLCYGLYFLKNMPINYLKRGLIQFFLKITVRGAVRRWKELYTGP